MEVPPPHFAGIVMPTASTGLSYHDSEAELLSAHARGNEISSKKH